MSMSTTYIQFTSFPKAFLGVFLASWTDHECGLMRVSTFYYRSRDAMYTIYRPRGSNAKKKKTNSRLIGKRAAYLVKTLRTHSYSPACSLYQISTNPSLIDLSAPSFKAKLSVCRESVPPLNISLAPFSKRLKRGAPASSPCLHQRLSQGDNVRLASPTL